MRLFVAFEISENVKQVLLGLQKKLAGRLTLVKDFHLTLKFLGEVEESKVDSIKESLGKIVFENFDCTLSQLGVFPDEKYVKVIWVGLEPHDAICSLQKDVDDATSKFGIKMDKNFIPHLTLARVKSIDNKKEFLDALKQVVVAKDTFNVSSFKLIKSTLTPQGPVYETIGEFKSE
jgi:2'-5' RNA ligase